LRALKDGWCTVQFNWILGGKRATQTVKGGNTDEFYAKEGTLPKSKMLGEMHPDCSSVVWRFNRWHHMVDYSRFKGNVLRLRKDIEVKTGVNNYGMVLIKKEVK